LNCRPAALIAIAAFFYIALDKIEPQSAKLLYFSYSFSVKRYNVSIILLNYAYEFTH